MLTPCITLLLKKEKKKKDKKKRGRGRTRLVQTQALPQINSACCHNNEYTAYITMVIVLYS